MTGPNNFTGEKPRGEGKGEHSRKTRATKQMARDDPRWFRMLASPLSFWHHIPWLYAGKKDFDREGSDALIRVIIGSISLH